MIDYGDRETLSEIYRGQLYSGNLKRLVNSISEQDIHFNGKDMLYAPVEHWMIGSSDETHFEKHPKFPIAIQKGVSVNLVRELRNLLGWMHIGILRDNNTLENKSILIKLLPLDSWGRVKGSYPNALKILSRMHPEIFDMDYFKDHGMNA